MSPSAPILLVSEPLPAGELDRLVGAPFPDMVKFVVDLDRRVVALVGRGEPL